MTPGTLLVVDVQNVVDPVDGPWGIAGLPEILPQLQALLAAFGDRSVLTRHRLAPEGPGTWRTFAARWAELEDDPQTFALHRGLRGAVPEGAAVVDKTTYSAFDLPEVHARLARAPQLVLTGCETDCCIVASLFAAVDAGVQVTLVDDALTGPDPAGHVAVLAAAQRLPEQVRVCSTAALLEELGR